jgi:hypothetical protein
MNDREQIEELYRTYWQCMINKDIAGMDRIMADDYELRHMTGLRQPKQDFFRSVKSLDSHEFSFSKSICYIMEYHVRKGELFKTHFLKHIFPG